MKFLDIALLALLAVAFAAAVIYSVKKARRGGGCGGNCASCSRACGKRD